MYSTGSMGAPSKDVQAARAAWTCPLCKVAKDSDPKRMKIEDVKGIWESESTSGIKRESESDKVGNDSLKKSKAQYTGDSGVESQLSKVQSKLSAMEGHMKQLVEHPKPIVDSAVQARLSAIEGHLDQLVKHPGPVVFSPSVQSTLSKIDGIDSKVSAMEGVVNQLVQPKQIVDSASVELRPGKIIYSVFKKAGLHCGYIEDMPEGEVHAVFPTYPTDDKAQKTEKYKIEDLGMHGHSACLMHASCAACLM